MAPPTDIVASHVQSESQLSAFHPEKILPIPHMEIAAKPRTADMWFAHMKELYPDQDYSGIKTKVDDIFRSPQSFTSRVITLYPENGDESFTITATVSTTVLEVKGLVAAIVNQWPASLDVLAKQGAYWRQQKDTDQVASTIKILGAKSFQRQIRKYTGPIVIIGGGFGGISSAIECQRAGHDFAVMERHVDFGGHSWMGIANKHTKLQTEKATYHVNYGYWNAPIPDYMPVWPSRDQLLEMFRKEARGQGIEKHTLFNTDVLKVKVRSESPREYIVQYGPYKGEGEVECMTTPAVMAWPGNLCFATPITFQGEDLFGGYIEYGSSDLTDYTLVEGKTVVLYGHGAFMIENVRTLIEHDCLQILTICRKRNLTAPKIASWLISQTNEPATGVQLLKTYEPMYKLAGFDPRTAHSVTCDSNRAVARIEQNTVFGVTDVYFLACYYGKCEVIIDEIKRLSYQTAHLKKGRSVQCEVILKVVGIQADFKTDKVLGIKTFHGYWVNDDVLRPCCCNSIGVAAQNFGTFSVGPAIASNTCTLHWFLDFPEDYEKIRANLPVRKADSRPAYVAEGSHWMQTAFAISNGVPAMGFRNGHFNTMKQAKQHGVHPLKNYLAECENEWKMYIEMIGRDDIPPPPYPYTEEFISGMMEEINTAGMFSSKAKKKQSME